MLKKIFKKKTYIIFLPLICSLSAQEKVMIQDLDIDIKQNGLFLTLHASEPLNREFITGWLNEDWFYITIHNAIGDSIQLSSTHFSYPVLEVQNSSTAESIQLAIRIKEHIEHFEFYFSNNDRTVLAALYYPAETVLAMIDEADDEHYQSKLALRNRLINVSYFAGAALSISGILSGDGSSSNNIELSLGLIILILTYLIDNFLDKTQ
ncbi:MAG: hypothetical protein IIB45_10915 [Candidatus Marinimicrobia bacterium]|nr:hypothetical protein [Candidatus Neomarinimicrobiota bacterium]